MGRFPSSRKFLLSAALLGGVALLALYFTVDPARSLWIPKCPLLMATGLKCPGCGSQRMLHALLHGDVATAFSMNALLFILIPLLALMGYSAATRTYHPVLYRRLNSVPMIVAVTIIIVAWFIVRNFIFPDL